MLQVSGKGVTFLIMPLLFSTQNGREIRAKLQELGVDTSAVR